MNNKKITANITASDGTTWTEELVVPSPLVDDDGRMAWGIGWYDSELSFWTSEDDHKKAA